MQSKQNYLQKTFSHDDVKGMLENLHEEGFALIPNVLNSEEVHNYRQLIDKLTPFHWDGTGLNEHFKCVFNRDKGFLDLLDREPIISLAEAAMGSQCHIIGQTAWRSHPKYDGRIPHTDRVFFDIPSHLLLSGIVKLPIYLCTAHFYLSDVTIDLCPTYVISGSHKSGMALKPKRGTQPEWQGKTLEPVLCNAGDVLFFRSEIWHSGGLNKTHESRYLIQNHYAHRFISQQFSPYLTWQFSPHILAQATSRQRRLLGEHEKGAYD